MLERFSNLLDEESFCVKDTGLLRHAFEDIGMQKVWCGYYEGNRRSKRVQEKCGFRYQWTTEGVDVPLMHEKRTGHVNLMTKDNWLWRKLYEAAKAVQKGRKISDYVEAGGILVSYSGCLPESGMPAGFYFVSLK